VGLNASTRCCGWRRPIDPSGRSSLCCVTLLSASIRVVCGGVRIWRVHRASGDEERGDCDPDGNEQHNCVDDRHQDRTGSIASSSMK